MDADGTNLVNVTDNPAADEHPTWSADGTQISFASDRDGNFEIYVINIDGTNPVRVTENPADDQYPHWRP
jgi:TolB protein